MTGKSRFDATRIVALKMQNEARLIEITVSDERGGQHVVSLPIPAALDLAQFISDACSFMRQLKQRPRHSAKS